MDDCRWKRWWRGFEGVAELSVHRRSGWLKDLAGLMLVKDAPLTQREAAGRLGLATGAGVSYQIRQLHRRVASHANLRPQVAKATNVLEASRECRGYRMA